ncbi:MAG: hypothetical protein ACKO96_15675 [Flammeovirgaceae bacterium]
MKRIDASHPGMFKYVFNKDAARTGNFNVWIQKGGNGEKQQIHDKTKSGDFPKANWKEFDSRFNAAMTKL